MVNLAELGANIDAQRSIKVGFWELGSLQFVLVLMLLIEPLISEHQHEQEFPYSPVLSVEIRLGKWERVFDQFNARLCITRNEYLDDVESKKDVRIIEHPQPCQRAARDSLLFLPIHCLERAAEIFSTTCFHLYEHECVFVTTNNINFAAAATAEIAQQDFVTATLQVTTR